MTDRYLAGRGALITGGVTGQGRAIALALAARGADVAVGSYVASHGAVPKGIDTTYPPDSDLKAVAIEIERQGAKAIAQHLDVRSASSVEALYAVAARAFGKVDILVNAAGISVEQPICGHAEQLWQDVIDVNLSGCYRTIRACLPGMIERRWGRIINIASTAASVGAKDNPAYCSSKHGLLGLTRCVGLEGAPHGVTCNAISPGYVDTNMARSSLAHMIERERSNKSVDQYFADIAATNPQKRVIQPPEIANVAAFLCRDESIGINADNITVSAGSIW